MGEGSGWTGLAGCSVLGATGGGGGGEEEGKRSGLTSSILAVVKTKASKFGLSSSRVVASFDTRGGLKPHAALCVLGWGWGWGRTGAWFS